nr:transposon TX1 putative 149 kDa protein [Tanacetum cinerariifolium]
SSYIGGKRNSSASFMFHNFPDSLGMGNLWMLFKKYDTVFDMFMVQKRLRNGHKWHGNVIKLNNRKLEGNQTCIIGRVLIHTRETKLIREKLQVKLKGKTFTVYVTEEVGDMVEGDIIDPKRNDEEETNLVQMEEAKNEDLRGRGVLGERRLSGMKVNENFRKVKEELEVGEKVFGGKKVANENDESRKNTVWVASEYIVGKSRIGCTPRRGSKKVVDENNKVDGVIDDESGDEIKNDEIRNKEDKVDNYDMNGRVMKANAVSSGKDDGNISCGKKYKRCSFKLAKAGTRRKISHSSSNDLGCNINSLNGDTNEKGGGNRNFGFTQMEAKGRSGGMLLIWDNNVFNCFDAMGDDRFITVKGGWKDVSGNIVLVCLYGLHISKEKSSLWDKLAGLDMEDFNNIINITRLVEIPLGGLKFTRISDDGLNFSKLDRFLVSEGFKNKWDNLSMVTLDRKLLDHCPIILKDMDVDFGLKPFCVFDIWFKEGDIENVVLKGWNKELLSDDAIKLEKLVDEKEVWEAVNSCGRDKALKPDGINFTFIKRFWDVFKKDLIDSIKWFWDKKEISRGCNASFVTLIPKVADPIGLGKYRPISLIGYYYKIIAKILVERIKLVIRKLVSEVQNAFIGDRWHGNVIELNNRKLKGNQTCIIGRVLIHTRETELIREKLQVKLKGKTFIVYVTEKVGDMVEGDIIDPKRNDEEETNSVQMEEAKNEDVSNKEGDENEDYGDQVYRTTNYGGQKSQEVVDENNKVDGVIDDEYGDEIKNDEIRNKEDKVDKYDMNRRVIKANAVSSGKDDGNVSCGKKYKRCSFKLAKAGTRRKISHSSNNDLGCNRNSLNGDTNEKGGGSVKTNVMVLHALGLGVEGKKGWGMSIIHGEKPDVIALQETKRRSGGMLLIWDNNVFNCFDAMGDDRFIAVKGGWKDVSVALDRKLSDHCPIVLKDMDVDFGLKPFCVSDIWFKEGDIENSRKKFRGLYEKINEYSKEAMGGELEAASRSLDDDERLKLLEAMRL